MNDPAMNEALKSYDLFFMNEDKKRMYVNRQMACMSEREAEGIKKGINLDMLKDVLGLICQAWRQRTPKSRSSLHESEAKKTIS